MAYGLDIYRYQTVTNWNLVKQDGVEFIIVKITDGIGPALVRGDIQVAGSHSVNIPVGAYHFAQKGNPVKQADVFKAELERLRIRHGEWGVIPALDIENTGVTWTGQEAHDFAAAFCREMLEYAPRVLLYANTSELKAMRAADIVSEVPGVYIWEAYYGSNNGGRFNLPNNAWGYRRAVHQYTSAGSVPGINGRVDLNDGNLGILLWNGKGEDDMAWSDKSGVKSENNPDYEYSFGELVVGSNVKDNENQKLLLGIGAKLDALAGTLSDDEANVIAAVRDENNKTTAALLSEFAKVATGNVDVDHLAELLRDSLGDAVASTLASRLAN